MGVDIAFSNLFAVNYVLRDIFYNADVLVRIWLIIIWLRKYSRTMKFMYKASMLRELSK